jgi:hypothetical protein
MSTRSHITASRAHCSVRMPCPSPMEPPQQRMRPNAALADPDLTRWGSPVTAEAEDQSRRERGDLGESCRDGVSGVAARLRFVHEDPENDEDDHIYRGEN